MSISKKPGSFFQLFVANDDADENTPFGDIGDTSCSDIIRAKFAGEDPPLAQIVNYVLAHIMFCEMLGIEYETPVKEINERYLKHTTLDKPGSDLITVESVASFARAYLRCIALGTDPDRVHIKVTAPYSYFTLSYYTSGEGNLAPTTLSIESPCKTYESTRMFFLKMNIDITVYPLRKLLTKICKNNSHFDRIFTMAMCPDTNGGDHVPQRTYNLPNDVPIYMYFGSYFSYERLNKRATDGTQLSMPDSIIEDQSEKMTYRAIQVGHPDTSVYLGDCVPQMVTLIFHGGAYGGWSTGSLRYWSDGFADLDRRIFFFSACCGNIATMNKYIKIIDCSLKSVIKTMKMPRFKTAPPISSSSW